MIAESYGHLLTYQIVGAPSWLNSEHFDIEARAEGNPAEDRIMLMVQSMLEDRFQLKIHHETRELPVFILTAAKGGLKVQAPRNGSCVAADPFQAPVGGVRNYCGNNLLRYQGANVAWDAMGIDMAGAAKILSSALHRAVIDKTGFTGKFDVHVKWTADRSTAGITDAAESAEPAVFTVLNVELGLQLKAGKGPVDVLVIDHVEPPDAN
jgi:uncharacterized protein (TIGR03435 family)